MTMAEVEKKFAYFQPTVPTQPDHHYFDEDDDGGLWDQFKWKMKNSPFFPFVAIGMHFSVICFRESRSFILKVPHSQVMVICFMLNSVDHVIDYGKKCRHISSDYLISGQFNVAITGLGDNNGWGGRSGSG